MAETHTCHVLVVEDDVIIAMDIEAILIGAGYRVVGPVGSVEAGRRAVAGRLPDCAILDVNLGSELVLPLADDLAVADVPIIFLTGHSSHALPPTHRDRPIIQKPYLAAVLLRAIASSLGECGPPPHETTTTPRTYQQAPDLRYR
jgi:DNA-binding response OmpR family regulator